MLIQVLAASLLVILKPTLESRSSLILLIDDFVKFQNTPLKISAHVCWNQKDMELFSKTLIKHHYLNMFTKPQLSHGLPEHHLFVMDLTCENSTEILNKAEFMKLFQNPYKWLFYGNSSVLSKFYFGVDSEAYVVVEKSTDTFSVKTVYKNSPESRMTETDLGNWSKNSGFSSITKHSLLSRRNLNGTTVQISYVVTNLDTLNHLWDYRDTHIDAITKLNYILVHHLIDFLNASKQFKMQRTWGYKNQTTGLYSGMAGDLQRGLADLGGTPLFFTIDRIDIIDYIAATTPTYMKFIFKAPPLSYVTNVFTLPFDKTVWHYSFIMVSVVVVCIYVIVIWEWREPRFRVKTQTSSTTILQAKFFDVMMMEIGAITQQGSDAEPRSNAGRIATIFTFVTLMFLYTSYSANIVALLQSTTDSIKSLEDLLNSRIKLGVEDIVYAHYYFENAEESIRKAIYQQKVAPKGQKPNFMTAEEGIKKVQEGFFAFHIELSTGYKIVSKIFQESEKCGLKEIEYVNLIEPWLSTRKNSSYKEIMKIGMKKIHESGLQSREVRRIYSKKPVCHGKGSNFGSVGMIDCYFPFLVFGIGVVISVILFLCEIIIKKYLKSLPVTLIFTSFNY